MPLQNKRVLPPRGVKASVVRELKFHPDLNVAIDGFFRCSGKLNDYRDRKGVQYLLLRKSGLDAKLTAQIFEAGLSMHSSQ